MAIHSWNKNDIDMVWDSVEPLLKDGSDLRYVCYLGLYGSEDTRLTRIESPWPGDYWLYFNDKGGDEVRVIYHANKNEWTMKHKLAINTVAHRIGVHPDYLNGISSTLRDIRKLCVEEINHALTGDCYIAGNPVAEYLDTKECSMCGFDFTNQKDKSRPRGESSVEMVDSNGDTHKMKVMEYNKDIGYIYFLISKGVVSYIGQTIAINTRIAAHKKDKSKIFDDVYYYECDRNRLNYVEENNIRKFRPKYNIAHNSRYYKDHVMEVVSV